MIRILTFLFISLLFIQCISQKKIDALQENKERYYPIAADGKWGFANEIGEIVIPYQFDSTAFFTRHGLAVAKLEGKYGYIDKNGEWHIKPKYNYANNFYRETVIVVKKQDTFSINLKGRRLSKLILHGIGFGGCKITLPANMHKHSIERDGKYALLFNYYLKEGVGQIPLMITDTTKFVYDEVQNFGRSHLLVKKEGKYGLYDAMPLKLRLFYPDSTGEYNINRDSIVSSLINFQYDFVETKYDTSRIADKIRMQKNGLWGVLRGNGTEGIPAEYLSIKHFYGILAFVEYEKGRFGYKRSDSGKEYFPRD